MEKRGAIYISRPPFPMTQDIVSGGGRIVLMPYDDTWRRLRKIMHQILSTRQSTTYRGYQDLESKQLLWDYFHVPEKWYLHNGRYSNSGMVPVEIFPAVSLYLPLALCLVAPLPRCPLPVARLPH